MAIEQKKQLTTELQIALKEAVRENTVEQQQLSSEVINAVCNCTEAVFIHGLKDTFFLNNSRYQKYPEPSFWPLVSRIAHGNTRKQIVGLSQIKTDVGRCRAWLRLSLNDASMENYVDAVIRESTLLRHYYHRYAFLRDPEQIEVFKGCMKTLARVSLSVPVNSSMLNSWTPTPLRLAGLIDDHYGRKVRTIDAIPEMDDMDVPVAQSALEFDGIDDTASTASISSSFVFSPSSAGGQMGSGTNSAAGGGRYASSVVSTVTPSYSTAGNSDDSESVVSDFSHASLVDAKLESILNHIDYLNRTSDFQDSGVIVGSPFADQNRAPSDNKNGVTVIRHGPKSHLQKMKQAAPSATAADENMRSRSRSRSPSELSKMGSSLQVPSAPRPKPVRAATVQNDRRVYRQSVSDSEISELAVHTDLSTLQQNSQSSDAILSSGSGINIDSLASPSISMQTARDSSTDTSYVTSQTEVSANAAALNSSFVGGEDKSELQESVFENAEAGNSAECSARQDNLQSMETAGHKSPVNFAASRQIFSDPGEKADFSDSHSKDAVFTSSLQVPSTNASPLQHKISVASDSSDLIFNMSGSHTGLSTVGLSPNNRKLSELSNIDARKRRMAEGSFSEDAGGGGGAWSSSDAATDASSFPPYSPLDDQISGMPFSPGNSLLGKSNWSSGFVSNLPHDGDMVSFNAIFQRALDNAVLSSSPLCASAIESTAHADFAAAANEPLEVGRAPGDDLNVTPPDGDEFEILKRDSAYASKNERIPFMTKIAQQSGLDSQNFHCRSCCVSIGLIYGEFRVCGFDGHYYCKDCHTDLDEMPIPGRIIQSWDFGPRKVSRASKSFLEHVSDEPLIDIQKANPTLYDYASTLKEIFDLRQQLSYVAMYLLTCKESIAEDLRKRLWPKEYLFESLHLYSYNDLLNVCSGQLCRNLKSILAFAIGHVESCRLCTQKGFICEFCNGAKGPKLIYAFQVESTVRCDACFSVFHAVCKEGRACPKCMRKEAYMKSKQAREAASGKRSDANDSLSDAWADDELMLHNIS